MIIQTITSNNFVDAFQHAGRDKQFSYEGKIALYNFLEDTYSHENYELDVIEICGSFSEYEDLEEFHQDYDPEIYPDLEAIECIGDWQVIPTRSGSFIISE